MNSCVFTVVDRSNLNWLKCKSDFLLIPFKLSQAVDCRNLTHKLTTIQIYSNLSTEFQSKNTNDICLAANFSSELVFQIPWGM